MRILLVALCLLFACVSCKKKIDENSYASASNSFSSVSAPTPIPISCYAGEKVIFDGEILAGEAPRFSYNLWTFTNAKTKKVIETNAVCIIGNPQLK